MPNKPMISSKTFEVMVRHRVEELVRTHPEWTNTMIGMHAQAAVRATFAVDTEQALHIEPNRKQRRTAGRAKARRSRLSG